MSVFGKWFGNKTAPASSVGSARDEIPTAEEILKRVIVDFHDRTKLHFVLIFPAMHQAAVRLYVEDFGVDAALRRYEGLVAALTSDGMIREDQFKDFGWPEAPAHEAAHIHELETLLWTTTRELVGKGFLKEAISIALFNIALNTGAQMDGLVSAGYLIRVTKELRAGVYTRAPEKRPEPPATVNEATQVLFIKIRDLAYLFKEHSGLEWQHILPGLQKACAIYCIRYRGRDRALELFRDQIQKLMPMLDQCPRNPPQQLPLTPLHITNMVKFDDILRQFSDPLIDNAVVHPIYVSEALSTLLIELTSQYYDMVFLVSILSSCCKNIECGKFDFVKKTH